LKKYYEYIKNRVEEIYSLIPNYNCKHCHKCCLPIIWFEPENVLIKEYLKNNNLDWSYKNFNNKKCSFLKENGCSIYPVRPIVCRLQGVISDLTCKNNMENNYLSDFQLKKIKEKFNKLLEETDSKNIFYSNRKVY